MGHAYPTWYSGCHPTYILFLGECCWWETSGYSCSDRTWWESCEKDRTCRYQTRQNPSGAFAWPHVERFSKPQIRGNDFPWSMHAWAGEVARGSKGTSPSHVHAKTQKAGTKRSILGDWRIPTETQSWDCKVIDAVQFRQGHACWKIMHEVISNDICFQSVWMFGYLMLLDIYWHSPSFPNVCRRNSSALWRW